MQNHFILFSHVYDYFHKLFYTLFKSKFVCLFVHSDFPLYNCYADTKNPLFKKQLMYFNFHITSRYFHICFILVANFDIKHIGRSSHSKYSPKFASKDFHKNLKNWFKIEARDLKHKFYLFSLSFSHSS